MNTYAPIYHTDAGRASAANGEKNDCTVRALVSASGATYAKCHRALEKAGRQRRKGAPLALLIEEFKIDGFFFEEVVSEPITIRKFLNAFPDGRYLCRIAKHAFAVVEGVVWDTARLRAGARITRAWQVTEL